MPNLPPAPAQSNIFRVFDRYSGRVETYTTSLESAEKRLKFLEWDKSQPVTNIGRFSIASPDENIIELDKECPMPRFVTLRNDNP